MLKVDKKTPERRQWLRFGVFIAILKHTSNSTGTFAQIKYVYVYAFMYISLYVCTFGKHRCTFL